MWDALKGWLDPRTQAKIEFVRTGPDTSRKLLEFIEPAHLPRAYGGLGASSYTCKEQAELLHVPRGGHLAKSVTVPATHKVGRLTLTLAKAIVYMYVRCIYVRMDLALVI